LTMFNGEAGNVRAYAVDGTFDDCHRLTREAFGDPALTREARLTSANSVNIGRLLPQMVYYFHALAQIGPAGNNVLVCTPSGNFGNLTAGLIARRAGLPIGRFVAATNANDVVPHYLATGRFSQRPALQTIANAMDVGHPSNFERMLWLYDSDVDAMRADVLGSCHSDAEIKAAIRQVYDESSYLLDPHSAIAYLGLKKSRRPRQTAVFLATAHPAKFREIVEPVIDRTIETPAPLAEALARPRHILRIDASLEAVSNALDV
jgi:threonine synthase